MRSSDGRKVQRFRCLHCKASFSYATHSPEFGHKKRQFNQPIFLLLCSSVSMNRSARLLGINVKTVARKLDFLGRQSKLRHEEFLQKHAAEGAEKFTALQFDEMETSERSKLLPLSIPIAVSEKSQKILGFRIAEMPAKGPHFLRSTKKYGPRRDDRPAAIEALLRELAPITVPDVHLISDCCPRYPDPVRKAWPEARYRRVKSRRACVVGQGELKRGGYDPLFWLNQAAAMVRANVNRLVRRTWCTTKRRDRLESHLWMYVRYHNKVLTERRQPAQMAA